MRYLAVLIIGLVINFSLIAQELPEYSRIYDEARDPFADATAAIKLAQATQRNVLIEVGGNWCAWCKKMDAFLVKNPEIYNLLHDNYVLLKVNVSDGNRNKAFMRGLPSVQGYPHMFISTAEGKMILSKDTAELQDKQGYSPVIWREFLTKWQPKTSIQNKSINTED